MSCIYCPLPHNSQSVDFFVKNSIFWHALAKFDLNFDRWFFTKTISSFITHSEMCRKFFSKFWTIAINIVIPIICPTCWHSFWLTLGSWYLRWWLWAIWSFRWHSGVLFWSDELSWETKGTVANFLWKCLMEKYQDMLIYIYSDVQLLLLCRRF